ncbi:quinone oxidoreductase [Actinocorallia sp. A-T 12471]|uniref:quinone oxidoreductase family protein n=1 Tax=Actinocorallia sp. A-T 12471 TaxID=3089813 RepID=UPI0029CCFB69|nr:quinone oxidoreductase [Actinocorallia sp. A-T 12471]MDX6742870.1 quinone oxidoreductase [Actinocorallia sp. A-T 12471]
MRAIVVAENGGPEVLSERDVPRPTPGPGELLVKVAAAGVNYIDTYYRTGHYRRELPFTLGEEAAGTVAEAGPGVVDFAVGDVVVSPSVLGGYAEYVLVEADRAVPVPAGVTPEQAAAVLLQGMTAHYLTHDTFPIGDGDTALLHAASGGVGLLAAQMVKLRGGRVIGTVSTPEKAELARNAGVDEVIGYDDFPARVRELTDGRGVDVVYDGVGKATFDGSLASLRPRGTLALFGAASGPVTGLDTGRLASAGSVFLTRPTLVHYTLTVAELRERAAAVFELVASGALDVHVGRTYPLSDARIAHEDLEGRRTTGKLLLVP